jgi:hypothetical protein
VLIAAVLMALGASEIQEPSLAKLTDRQLAARIPRRGEPQGSMDPVTKHWTLDPVLAELRRRVEAGNVLDVECWRTILTDRGYLRWREIWPTEVPFAVSFHVPALGQGLEVVLAPSEPGWLPASASHWEMMCGLGMDTMGWSEEYQELGPLRSDATKITFLISIEMPLDRKSGAARPPPARIGTVAIDVRPVARLDEVLQRTEDADMAKAIASSLRLEVARNAQHRNAAWLEAAFEAPPHVACNLEVTLVRDGKPLPFSNLWLDPLRRRGSAEVTGLEPQIVWGRKPTTGLSLRLRGTPANVLRNWDATHYWTGELEIPVADLVERNGITGKR